MQVEGGALRGRARRRWGGRPARAYAMSVLVLAVATPVLVGDWLILAHVLAPLRTLGFTP